MCDRRLQARSACLAFPYMVDAHLLVEAVTDASKGGEAAFGAWTVEQLERMRAAYGGDSVPEPCAGIDGATCTADAAATVGGDTQCDEATAVVEGPASGSAPEPAPGPASAVAEPATGAEPLDGAELRTGTADVGGGEEVKTLSQLAAWHVGDVLRRAGVRPPPWRSAPAQPAAAFGCPPLS